MRMARLAALFLPFVLPATVPAQDAKALTAGEWKVVKSADAPPGTRIRFGADGKLTMTFAIDGRPHRLVGSYAVAGDQLTLRLTHNGKERVETRTIRKLTVTTLVTEDKNRKVEELESQR